MILKTIQKIFHNQTACSKSKVLQQLRLVTQTHYFMQCTLRSGNALQQALNTFSTSYGKMNCNLYYFPTNIPLHKANYMKRQSKVKWHNTPHLVLTRDVGASTPSSVHNRRTITETNHCSHSPLQPSSPSRGNTKLFSLQDTLQPCGFWLINLKQKCDKLWWYSSWN